jgi:hypothetical protein
MYKKFFEIRSFLFNAQITVLWNRSKNWLAGLNLNIADNTTEYIKLTDFWGTLYK